MNNIIYIGNLNLIGGTETFIYYLIRKYGDYGIKVYYKSGSLEQINRLRQYTRVKRYNGEKIKCKVAIFNYHVEIIDNVEAEEYIQVIHTDFKEQKLHITPNPKITKFIGVTQVVCDSFKEYTGKDCELGYNPLFIEKPKKVLKLISGTRLTKEKGAGRMMRLADELKAQNIPFMWLVFTDDVSKITHPNIFCLPAQMNIMDYIAQADYLVQLSNKGEGFGYTPAEALSLGVPVITTPCPAFLEIGVKDRENGFVLDYDMNDIPIKEIYKGLPKFKYEPPKDRWGELLIKGDFDYEKEANEIVSVKCIRKYNDIELGVLKTPNSLPYEVKRSRAEDLADDGFVKILEGK